MQLRFDDDCGANPLAARSDGQTVGRRGFDNLEHQLQRAGEKRKPRANAAGEAGSVHSLDSFDVGNGARHECHVGNASPQLRVAAFELFDALEVHGDYRNAAYSLPSRLAAIFSLRTSSVPS